MKETFDEMARRIDGLLFGEGYRRLDAEYPVEFARRLRAELAKGAEPESIERRKAEWAALGASISSYASDYEFGDYTPDDGERQMCMDFAHGLIGQDDFVAAIAQVYPVRSRHAAPPPAADEAKGAEPVAWMTIDYPNPPHFYKNESDALAKANSGDVIQPLYVAPPASAEDAKDAARYRFLRDMRHEAYGRGNLIKGAFLEELDKVIDAAIAAEASHE